MRQANQHRKEDKMKLYNIEPEKRTFDWGEMAVVALGERGRGRHQELVPFHAAFDPAAEDYEIGQTQSGKPKIVRTGNSSEGWIARLSGEGCYTRGTYGTVYAVSDDRARVGVRAIGSGAYGAAGRVGDWNEFLVVIKPPYPARFYVRPSGGEHKIARYWLVFTENVRFPARVRGDELEAFSETTGIVFPAAESLDEALEKRLLIDLSIK